MTPEQLIHIDLKRAYLCLETDCSAIGNSSCYCPACNSTKVYSLAKLLDGQNSDSRPVNGSPCDSEEVKHG
jgi:hypothetical protein